MQELALKDASLFQRLTRLSLDFGAGRPDPQLDTRYFLGLPSLRALSLKGMQGVCSTLDHLQVTADLTSLLLWGVDDLDARVNQMPVDLLRLQGLQCLDVEVALEHNEVAAGTEERRQRRDDVIALEECFFLHMEAALDTLPLHFGARVVFRGGLDPPTAEASVAKQRM